MEILLTMQEAIDNFNTSSDFDNSTDSVINNCQFPPDESWVLIDEEKINKNEFEKKKYPCRCLGSSRSFCT